jgi:ArsR family transcriptional regulator, arsenate/arsenite/antimonite-responsive transcriptional repressor
VTEATLLECCTPLARPTLTEDEAVDLEQLLKALADRHRVRIVNILSSTDDAVCVCALEPELGLAQPTVSYHLKMLVTAGLLLRERRGRFSYYRLAPGALDRVGSLVAGGKALAA